MLVTALVTPFRAGGERLDLTALQRLVRFQLEEGCDQVLLAGTTGEGTALDDAERRALLAAALEAAGGGQRLMLALGGGRVLEVVARAREALDAGVRDVLLMDCPYVGPSSAALRTAWYGPIAAAVPEARITAYTVPGRTGSELLPDDLARLVEDRPNVVGVKDATGRLARMTRVRQLCGADFLLLCGDDHLLRDALLDPSIRADGAIAFSGNLAPAALAALIAAGRAGEAVRARELHDALGPVFELVAVTAEERLVLRGETLLVPQRSKNPVPMKAALGLLGVIGPDVRAPLAPAGPASLARVRTTLRLLARRQSSVLAPLDAFFGLDIARRLEAAEEPVAVAASP